jgi:hypothetical protein
VDASFACAIPGEVTDYSGGLPVVDIQVSPEDYSPRTPPVMCERSAKPGVVLFRKLVLESLGGRDLGICRDCAGAPSSDHHEGRAWDWGMDAGNPGEAARVHQLIQWLLASSPEGEPHENFRRLGLRYVIWDRQIWASTTKEWRPYTGRSAHAEHVHFSFSWPGARAETSFYDWLRGGSLPPPGGPRPFGMLFPIVLVAGGAVAGWVAVTWASGRTRRR